MDINICNRRRDFLMLGTAAIATVPLAEISLRGAVVGAAATSSVAPDDLAILQLASDVKYLEASFYASAVRRTAFSEASIKRYANEIAGDKIQHLEIISGTLGSQAVAFPVVDISADRGGAFSTIARAAGLATAEGAFNPYASDLDFLMAGHMLEAACAALYATALPLLRSEAYLSAVAPILADAAFHPGLIHTAMQSKRMQRPRTVGATAGVLAALARLGGSPALTLKAPATGPKVALNTLYLASRSRRGGFFPLGVTGAINVSA